MWRHSGKRWQRQKCSQAPSSRDTLRATKGAAQATEQAVNNGQKAGK